MSSGHEQVQKRMLFFVSRQLMLGVDGSFVERSVANDIGYVQSGFFNRVLAYLIQASNIDSIEDLYFAKSFVTLKRGCIIYNIRAHKSHISLEVKKTEVGSCVGLTSHVEKVICRVMEEFQMNAFNMCSLLEYDDTYLSYQKVR